MQSLEEKRDLIRAHERQFARELSSKILEKPPLDAWMILIPFIFVFWFMRFNKVSQGQKEFVENYMVTRNRALDEALCSIEERREPDCERLLQQIKVPEGAREEYGELLRVLLDEYTSLLRVRGKDFESLVKAAYGSKTNYLLTLNTLNQVERKMNKALEPVMSEANEGAVEAMRKIESHSVDLRRQFAELVFP